MKTNVCIIFTAATLVLAACNNDNELVTAVDNTDPVAAQFTAGIVTRAFDQQWEVNDSIGVTGTSGTVLYQNVAYHTVAGNGVFMAATTGSEIYFQTIASVSFTAYYPFTGVSEASPGVISASSDNQRLQKGFDFLYGTGSGSKATPVVAFRFEHSMTKLILNIKPGADITFADLTGGSSSLTGVNHAGTFDHSNGTAATSGMDLSAWTMSDKATPSDVTIPAGSEVRTYSLILFPQTMASLTYTATIGGQTYTASIGTALTIEAGKSYSYNITVNKTGLTISSATIAEWTVGNGAGGADVDAEM